MASIFNPPGYLDDLSAEQKLEWSGWISDNLDSAVKGNASENDGPRPQFFNPAKKPIGGESITKDISWTAFPKQLSSPNDRLRWSRADASRDGQDEYCEWSIEREGGKIVRIKFTCEGPEYWAYLAQVNPEKVLDLYREHVSPEVKEHHIFGANGYIRRNRWNNSTSNGVMHLIQRANTLSAEIELAGGASLQRARADGTLLTGAQELIQCSLYGAAGRHSDPHIGEEVNKLARQQHDVTLADPIGLYFAGLDTSDWRVPNKVDPQSLWKYTRGKDGKFVRAVLEAPEGAGFMVGDVKIGGKPIEFAAQVADCITIKLTGLATRLGQSAATPVQGCRLIGAGAGMEMNKGVAGALREHRGR
jgi:hypothetical protein